MESITPKYEIKKLINGGADFKFRDKTTSYQYRSVNIHCMTYNPGNTFRHSFFVGM
jgi:hypothetical protein